LANVRGLRDLNSIISKRNQLVSTINKLDLTQSIKIISDIKRSQSDFFLIFRSTRFSVYISPSIHPSTYCSMGSVPVGAQCPLTSSLSEFLGYWDWLWYPGLLPMLVSIAFPFAFHISVFPIHSSSLAIEVNSYFFIMTYVSAPIGQPFT